LTPGAGCRKRFSGAAAGCRERFSKVDAWSRVAAKELLTPLPHPLQSQARESRSSLAPPPAKSVKSCAATLALSAHRPPRAKDFPCHSRPLRCCAALSRSPAEKDIQGHPSHGPLSEVKAQVRAFDDRASDDTHAAELEMARHDVARTDARRRNRMCSSDFCLAHHPGRVARKRSPEPSDAPMLRGCGGGRGPKSGTGLICT